MSYTDDVVLSRSLKARSSNDASVRDIFVRFMRPRYEAPRSDAGDIDTKVEFLIEIDDLEIRDHGSGGDDVSAMLAAFIVARAHLITLMRAGYEVWWLEPGDIHSDDFWGFEIGRGVGLP